ncbi:MAG: hypothetical protein CV087_17635 [Candidatus Brocadia sp. WS118]|nr:MAG: hypothetical protein CV087_17635 [Candidatus Brocadia sp. WS118]
MAEAKKDGNRVSTLIGVSSVDLSTPTKIAVNPETGAVLADATVVVNGVESIAVEGETALTGAVTLSEGTGITLTQVGQDIEIAATNNGTVTDVTATAPLTSSGGATPDISTSMATNKLIGRGTAGTGVMEEITLGTNLSLSGTTLNAAGGSPGGADTQVQFNDGGSFGGDAGLTYNKTSNVLSVSTINSISGEALAFASVGDNKNITLTTPASGSATVKSGNISLTTGTGNTTGVGGGLSFTTGAGGNNSRGGDISFITGSAGGGDNNSGDFTVSLGAGSGSESGGFVDITAGIGGATGDGGYIQLLSGGGGATSGAGGLINIAAGSASGGGSEGGDITITSGNGATDGSGGDIVLTTGTGGVTAGGGELRINLGNSGGGDALGGYMNIYSGNGSGFGDGGFLNIELGNGGATGDGGYLNIIAGGGGATSGAGGSVNITAGNASAGNSNGGGVYIIAGAGSGSGTNGAVYITNSAETNWISLDDAFTIAAGGTEVLLDTTSVTVARTFSFPDLSGTFALEEGFTTSGNITLGENTSVVLDSALSADGKYTGITRAGTAGATLAFGDLVYLAAADSRWELADADAASTSGDVILGMCVLAAAADGDPTTILLYGTIRADTAFPALTIGAQAYVSTTAGDIQVAQPSGTDDVIRVVGFALTADELLFNPSADYITHA